MKYQGCLGNHARDCRRCEKCRPAADWPAVEVAGLTPTQGVRLPLLAINLSLIIFLVRRMRLIAFSVEALELLRSHPLSLRCIQNAWAAISARETPFYCAFLGVVCSIPCHLPYGLRHHVIFGPGQVGGVA